MLDLGSTLAGGAIAILGSIIAPIFFRIFERAQERKSVISAFIGEISSLSAIVTHRDYVNTLKQTIKRIEDTRKPCIFSFEAKQDYFNVFRNYISKIGVLPSDLPAKLLQFYIQSFSIAEDVRTLREEPKRFIDIQYCIKFHIELLLLLESTQQLGKELLEDLRRHL